VDGTPSEVGAQAELAIASALVGSGRRVYLPFFGPDSRTDLVFEDEAGFHRVQCKTSRLVGGALVFATCSNTKQVRKDYRGQIDLFGVYSPDLGAVFLVPVADVPPRAATLRLEPARNGQTAGVRWARDYLVGRSTLPTCNQAGAALV
jgi:hypothetical protein